MNEQPERFLEDGTRRFGDFRYPMLVACPKCRNCATVIDRSKDDRSPFGLHGVFCSKCEFFQEWNERKIHYGHFSRPVLDDYFHLPLWLQAPCCGDTLWAYNAEHLGHIKNFVGATLRERVKLKAPCVHSNTYEKGWNRELARCWSSHTFTARLPRWMKSSKNREAILKVTSRLETSIPEEYRYSESDES